jgi:hypothetical protein
MLLGCLIIVALLLAFACEDVVGIRGSGDLVTEDYTFEDFTDVELSHSFHAEITYSDSYSVSVEVDDNILDLVEVFKDGDTLRLGLESGFRTRNVTLNATITIPELFSLELSGATRATVTGFENMQDLDVQLSGASRLDGELDVTHLDLRLSGASRATLEGGGTEADLDASGASSLDLEDFLLEFAHVKLSGASNATVNVRDELGPIDASGASHLRYIGDPTLTDVDTSGASSVDHID